MSISEIIVQVLQRVAISLGELVQPIATLIAAFSGAWFAYRLQDKAKRRAERMSNIGSANLALFTVFQQINSLKVIQMDIIDPVRNHPGKFLAMRPILHDEQESLQFDFPNIGFLLNTKYKQIVLDLFVEHQRFREAIKAINYRSDLHIKSVQPALARAGVQEGVDYPPKFFEEALGPILSRSLPRITDQVIHQVDSTIGSLYEIKGRMIKAFKELYPEGDFLNFEPIEDPTEKLLNDNTIKPLASADP